MTEDKWSKLIDGLTHRTERGGLSWDAPTDDTLIVLLEVGAVRIERKGPLQFVLTLRNEAGRPIESQAVDRWERSDLQEQMGALWELGWRKALQADDVWDKALSELTG